MSPGKNGPDNARLDRLVAAARRSRERRERGYREQALKILPWICGRCAREFDRTTRHQLTVHHKDGNHDNNPRDGSNWELLCVYCHDDEHSRHPAFRSNLVAPVLFLPRPLPPAPPSARRGAGPPGPGSRARCVRDPPAVCRPRRVAEAQGQA